MQLDKNQISVGSWLSLCGLLPGHLGVRPQFPGWERDSSKEYVQLGIIFYCNLRVRPGSEMSEISSTIRIQLMQTSELRHTQGICPRRTRGPRAGPHRAALSIQRGLMQEKSPK